MHRGTTIEDAGYATITSWPIVPDVKSAQENTKHIGYVRLGALPAIAIAYFALSLSGSPVYIAAGAAVAVAIAAGYILFKLKKDVDNLLLNCKMIKIIADKSGSDVEHAAKVVFEAVTRKGETERLSPLNDGYGVYVNAGYKMDDGRTEAPYVIFIEKVSEEAEVQKAA